jgi:hypothetical protein
MHLGGDVDASEHPLEDYIDATEQPLDGYSYVPGQPLGWPK